VVLGIMMRDDVVPIAMTEIAAMMLHNIYMSSVPGNICVPRTVLMLSGCGRSGQQRNAPCQNATCA
jgi:hypothetical protein